MWKEVTLRQWQRKPLAISGDYSRWLMLCEKSLKHRNFKGSALIDNIA